MRVLLINPPEQHEPLDNIPTIIAEGRGYTPPLGLLYIAAYVEQDSKYEVAIIDCQAEQDNYESLHLKVRAFSPDIVGITAMTMTLLDVIETVETVRAAAPGAKVVLGGPHAHLFPEETIQLNGVDFVVLGEGERTFKSLLDHIEEPTELRNVPGLVFRNGQETIRTGTPLPIEDLDSLPFPARHLTQIHKYRSLLALRDPVTSLFTSRGCPFKCAFCDKPHLGRRFRARSARNVVDEIEQCVRMGINDFLIYDDTFTVYKGRVLEICDEIQKRRLDVGFHVRTRVDCVDEEMLKRLKRAGCRGIHYGVEAGTEKVLRALNKGITLERIRATFELTRRHRIPTLAYFMIGNPSETLEDIRSTFEFMKRLNPDYVHLTILCPFPGTQCYKDALEKGIISYDCWKEFAAHPSPEFVPPHWGELFSYAQLEALVTKGYRDFYLRPSYIWRRLAKVKSANELLKKAKGAFKVMRLGRTRRLGNQL